MFHKIIIKRKIVVFAEKFYLITESMTANDDWLRPAGH